MFYFSFDTNISATLFTPTNVSSPVPCAILLAGLGNTKKSMYPVASWLAHQGVASFSIDRRGVGDTKGEFKTNQDLFLFKNNLMPNRFKTIYDTIRSFDLLSQLHSIDKNNIFIIGESFGGIGAIISAAIEPKVSSVVCISTGGGFNQGLPSQGFPEYDYSFATDPLHYVDSLSNQPILFIHSLGDKNIPYAFGEKLYYASKEPKLIIKREDTYHGYLKEDFPKIFDFLNKNQIIS